MKECRKCKKQYDDSVAFCPNCGKQLIEAVKAAETTEVVEKTAPGCKKCGETLSEGVKFCPKCGEKSKTVKKKKKMVLALAAAGILVLCTAIILTCVIVLQTPEKKFERACKDVGIAWLKTFSDDGKYFEVDGVGLSVFNDGCTLSVSYNQNNFSDPNDSYTEICFAVISFVKKHSRQFGVPKGTIQELETYLSTPENDRYDFSDDYTYDYGNGTVNVNIFTNTSSDVSTVSIRFGYDPN